MTTGSNTRGPTGKYSADPLTIQLYLPLQDFSSPWQDAFSAQRGQTKEAHSNFLISDFFPLNAQGRDLKEKQQRSKSKRSILKLLLPFTVLFINLAS